MKLLEIADKTSHFMEWQASCFQSEAPGAGVK